jgi:hypothetical protein
MKKKKAIRFLRDHGYHEQADNLEYIFGELSPLFSRKNNHEIDKDTFYALKREITFPWVCKFSIPNDKVLGIEEYVQVWRSQKKAEKADKQWIWVDQEFWTNRVFGSLVQGINPHFDDWEYIGDKTNYPDQLYYEAVTKIKNLEGQLAYLNALIKNYHPEAYFTSEKECTNDHFCGCGEGWYLTLHLPDKELKLEMKPFDNAFKLIQEETL